MGRIRPFLADEKGETVMTAYLKRSLKRGVFLAILGAFLACIGHTSTEFTRNYDWTDDKANGIPITASRMDEEFDDMTTKLNQKVLIKSTAPNSPISGMTWYDSTNKQMKQYRNNEWVGLQVNVATTAAGNLQVGDIWYDTGNLTLQAYDGSSWDVYRPVPSTTKGEILYASDTDVLSALTTVGTESLYLSNQGGESVPAWELVDLETGVTGTLPAANAGTRIEQFTSSGTFNVPSNISLVFVSGCGAGGGGGGASPGNGGGGGGGGQCIVNYPYSVTPSGTVTVTINAGGAGSAGGLASDGGTSVFGTLTLAGGGGGDTLTGGTGGGGRDAVTTTVGNEGIKGGNGAVTAGGGTILGDGGAAACGAPTANTGAGGGGEDSGQACGTGATGAAGQIIVMY